MNLIFQVMGKRLYLWLRQAQIWEIIINGDLYILDITSGKLQKMNGDKLLGGSVCFSPDGS